MAELVPAGIATDCDNVSVRRAPVPPSQAFHLPVCAGSAVELSITCGDAFHPEAVVDPASKLGSFINCVVITGGPTGGGRFR